MAAEIVVLNETTCIHASVDEELLLDYEEDGEFHFNISHCSFHEERSEENGFCEVVVPSYSIDEFRSHFRMTKTTFEVFAQDLAACTLENRTLSSSHVDTSQVRQIKIGVWPGTGFEWLFRSDIPFGNFGLSFKTFRLFWKISVRANQNSLTINIPTEISGIFR